MKLTPTHERLLKLERKLKEQEDRQIKLEAELVSLILQLASSEKVHSNNISKHFNDLTKVINKVDAKVSKLSDLHKPDFEKLQSEVKQIHNKLSNEIDRLRSKAEEAVNALDVSAFNNFKAAVKVALEAQRKENLKDLQRLNARIDKLKDKVKNK